MKWLKPDGGSDGVTTNGVLLLHPKHLDREVPACFSVLVNRNCVEKFELLDLELSNTPSVIVFEALIAEKASRTPLSPLHYLKNQHYAFFAVPPAIS